LSVTSAHHLGPYCDLDSCILVPPLTPLIGDDGHIDDLEDGWPLDFRHQEGEKRPRHVVGYQGSPSRHVGVGARRGVASRFRQTDGSDVGSVAHWPFQAEHSNVVTVGGRAELEAGMHKGLNYTK